MQRLSEKWLRLFNIYYILYSLVTVGIYVYLAQSQGTLLIEDADKFGSGILSAAFGFIALLYNLVLLRFVRKHNIWLAYVISFGLFGITNSIATEIALDGPGEIFFRLNSYLLTVASVTLGPVVSFAVISVTSIVFGMILAGTTQPSSLGITGDTIDFVIRLTVVVCLLLIIRKRYTHEGYDSDNYVERYLVNNHVVKLLTNSIGDGVIIIDKNEVVRSINPAALSILGQAESDATDLNYRSILKFKNVNGSNMDPDKDPIGLSLKEQKTYNQEVLLPKNGNQDVFIDLNVSAIANDDTNELYGAIIILRDISKKKREEAARSEFISTASHEMRTPVAAIEGYLALALNPNVSQIDPKTKSFLEKAYASTQHLGTLFQDLLISTRAEDGRLVSHPEVIEMGEILQRQAEYFTAVAQKKGLQLEFVVGTERQTKHDNNNIRPLYYSYVDPARIQEVTTNLIDNAIKYTQSGKVTIGLTGNKEVVQFFIRDTGAGISAEDIPHLFQKFYRVDSSATRTTGGTGLGLFICRKIIELYRGRIWVQSKVGEGSTFFINLPRIESAQAKAIKIRDAAQGPHL